MSKKPKQNQGEEAGIRILDAAIRKQDRKAKKNRQTQLVQFVPQTEQETASAPPDSGTRKEEQKLAEPKVSYNRVPFDYTRVNRMQLEGHLTRPEVFDKVRLYLAFLVHNRERHLEGHTYFSIRMKLRALGFPPEVDKVKDVYFSYCRSQGGNDTEIEQDLRIYRAFLEGKKTAQVCAATRAQREMAGNTAYPRRSNAGRCDPECNIL